MNKTIISDCPSQHDLERMVYDTIPAGDTVVADHITTCISCQRTLDLITDSYDLKSYQRIASERTDCLRYLGKPLQAGDLGSLNEYAIERKIGEGGMGVVFQGRDDRLGRRLAVKVLSHQYSADADRRFLRESKAAAKLEHDHVVPIYAAGRTENGIPYLAMKLIEGISLRERIGQGDVSVREAVDLIRQVASGLHAAHQADLIHRDVKPGNVLLDQQDGRAKLMDFGLARIVGDEALTRANVLSGTPEYMSPGQIANPDSEDRRDDIYSLGITFYECLTGTAPYRGQTMQILQQHQFSEPIRPAQLVSSIPRDVETICLKAIAKDADRRYQTALEFAEDLQRFLDGKPIHARETTQVEKLWMWSGRNRGVAALAATSVALLLALGIGSSIAAWRLNSANRLVTAEKQKAIAAEESALTDRSAAIKALSRMVDSLYDELSIDEATIKTREKIVTAAIEGLQSITHVAGDQQADDTNYQAFLRIGDLTSLRGANREAVENYEKAIALAREKFAKNPHEAQAQRELSLAINRLGVHYFRLGNAKASDLFEESGDLLKVVLKANPNDMGSLANLVNYHGQVLDVMRGMGDQTEVIKYGESIEPDIERLFEQPQDDNIMACKAAQKIHFCIGRAYLESNNFTKAEEHFVAARPYLDRALRQSPANVELRAASAIMDRALGMVIGALGRVDEALKLFEQALDGLKKLSAADPDNRDSKINIANTVTIMSTAFAVDGRHEEAIEKLDEGLEIYEELRDKAPDDENVRTLIANARLVMTGSQLGLNRWDDGKQTYRQILKELNDFEFGAAMQPAENYYRNHANISLEAIQRMLGEATDNKTVSGECFSLLLLARQAGQTATSETLTPDTLTTIANINPDLKCETFADLFDHIDGLKNVDSEFAAQRKRFRARVEGFLAENYSKSRMADGKKLSADALARSIESIEAIVAQAPAAATDLILNDPDLKWVRQTAEFKAAWANRPLEKEVQTPPND